jgi:signal transduction histidine kinase
MPPHSPAPDLAAALAACAAPTASVDADGRVLQANDAFARHFGRPLRLGELATALDGPVAALAGHGPVPLDGGELHLRALDAATWWAQWLPTAADRGAEQRHLQMFADTVAHDLRAPLRSIDSFAKLLEDRAAPKLDASERMHLSRIRAAATRMSGLLAALGELSRAASAPLVPVTLDISVLAEWVAAELSDEEPSRQVEVEVQPGLVAVGDERLVRQALRALLENAWKFTRGREGARIEVRGQREGDRLRVEIRDNGAGFDMQYCHKLFQPFQRLHGVEQGAGHGLGLATAQRIARRHGGDVRAASDGDGAVFTLVLPAPAGEGGA